MNEKEANNGIAIAALKLSVIQLAFNGTFPDMSKKDYYIRIAAKPLKLPDGCEARYSPGTYACWESDYRKGGFDALIPKERADRGHSRKLDPDAIAKIYELHERYPKLSTAVIRNRMIADGLINAADVSVTTFQRFFKKNNLKGASTPGQKDRRAFEEEFSTGMFQADTLYGPYISENGSPYKNEQLSLICGQLGSVLIHTPVRDGASKGKVERNFRTLRSKFLNAIDPSRLKGIAELNLMLADYIRSHNTSVHSATGMTPYSRYMEDNIQPYWQQASWPDIPEICIGRKESPSSGPEKCQRNTRSPCLYHHDTK